MLGWLWSHLSLPGEECSSDDGRCLSRERKRHDVVQMYVVHPPRVVCGVQACENRPMAQRRSSGATLGASLKKHAGPSHVAASDPGILHAPHVMAQVVGRAAEGSGDGTLAC